MVAPLGNGERFKSIQDKVSKLYRKKGESPAKAKEIGGAIAASVGRKKYGAKKFNAMAQAGRR